MSCSRNAARLLPVPFDDARSGHRPPLRDPETPHRDVSCSLPGPPKLSTRTPWSGLASRSFVLQGVDNCPSLRPDYSIDGDLEALLQILDRRSIHSSDVSQ